MTYDQLANCLLFIDTSLRWLNLSKAAPTANTIICQKRNRISQFQAISSALLPLRKPYNRISAFPSFLISSSSVSLRLSALSQHMPSTSQAKADACFNCGKAGHWLSECPLPCTSQTELKELQEALKSDSGSDDKLVTGRPGKDTL